MSSNDNSDYKQITFEIIEIMTTFLKEHNDVRFLEMVLDESMKLCNSDGGTLYLVSDENELEFFYMCNRSMNMKVGGSTGNECTYPALPLTIDGKANHNHEATHVAITGEPCNIKNVYEESDLNFEGAKNIDEGSHYKTISLLAYPLKNHRDEIIGVIQLINAMDSKNEKPIPFTQDQEKILGALAQMSAGVFAKIVTEKELRTEIKELKIEIDEAQKKEEVHEIVESEYFQDLLAMSEKLKQDNSSE